MKKKSGRCFLLVEYVMRETATTTTKNMSSTKQRIINPIHSLLLYLFQPLSHVWWCMEKTAECGLDFGIAKFFPHFSKSLQNHA